MKVEDFTVSTLSIYETYLLKNKLIIGASKLSKVLTLAINKNRTIADHKIISFLCNTFGVANI